MTDQLCKAFLVLENIDEVYNFLEDVATIGEIRALAQRLEVARLLEEGVYLSPDSTANGCKHGNHKPGEEIS